MPVYKRPEKTPITLTVRDNRIEINIRVRYNAAAIRPWDIDGVCLADLIEAAIVRYWSGSYWVQLQNPFRAIYVRVSVNIRRCETSAVPITVRPLFFMPAHVISPWYRRIWGIFRTGQWESLGTNWSLCQPGRMVLPKPDPDAIGRFERLVAHEAGHLFGLGDAYGAIYRYYYEAPATRRFMMNRNFRVQPREIKMLLDAHQTGKMQFFPRKWIWENFREGLKKEIEQRAALLEKKMQQRRRPKKTNRIQ